jgi:hypothetical protein
MSGQVVLFSTRSGKVMAQRRDHRKYVVRVAAVEIDNDATHGGRTFYIATAGWDARILLYRLHLASSGGGAVAEFPEPAASLELPSNPEDVHFHQSTAGTILIATRRDSAALHYFAVPSLTSLGTQTLAPRSGPWTPFSLTSISASPRDASLLAVATSGTEFTKLIVVRVLLPDSSVDSVLKAEAGAGVDAEPEPDPESDADAQRTRARDDTAAAAAAAAIYLAVSTHSPSSAWSTPKAIWRPDGSGVWVNGDDGAVRGVEVPSGKVVVTLGPRGVGVRVGHDVDGDGDGHDVDAKIRDLWAGWRASQEEEAEDVAGAEKGDEWLLSAGFDRRALLWTI